MTCIRGIKTLISSFFYDKKENSNYYKYFLNMKIITNEDLLSIWKSVNMYKQKELDITLFLKSSGDAGTLWYIDSDTNKTIIVAEGDISISNFDIYYLTIGDKRLIIRPEMNEDFMTSFELEVPNFGFVLFVRTRN